MNIDKRFGVATKPRRAAHAEKAGNVSTGKATSKAKGRSIVVVDDTPANLRLLSGMLSGSGYHVRPAPSGALALSAIEAMLPDLVLLDINMPEMDGYEVCRRLKANPHSADIPIIFISALNEVEDKVKAFEMGGVDYITKPFQFQEVLARVQTHLSLRQAREDLRGLVEQNKMLVREAYHRVSNNMQVIKSLLSLQTKRLKDPQLIAVLRESQERIETMTLIHRRLYQAGEARQLDFAAYLRDLVREAQSLFEAEYLQIDLDSQALHLDVEQAIPCGLVVNELLTNVFKYAFPPAQRPAQPELQLRLRLCPAEAEEVSEADTFVELQVRDNGVGMATDVLEQQANSLGLVLIRSLSQQQLRGSIRWYRLAASPPADEAPSQGTLAVLRFPLTSDEETDEETSD